jgi:SNF2 family DNA or RNA helicase
LLLKQKAAEGEGGNEENQDGGDVDAEQAAKKESSYNSPKPDEALDSKEKQDTKIKDNLKNSSKVYYEITHSISEQITEQPHLLTGGKLKSYQMLGLNWMISLYNNNLNGILADEMGLGKTIQTISLFAYLIGNKQNDGPFLVVVPLATINNWMNEFASWAPSIRLIVYRGKKSERPMLQYQLKNEKFNVVLTTYEYILNDKATLCKIHWQYIIVDEG